MSSLCVLNKPLVHIVLDRPRIAANVAAIVRLATSTKSALHICGPLIFDEQDKTKWRAGLDYFFGARVHFHRDIHRCLELLGQKPWIIELGGGKTPYDVCFESGDVIVFGPENGSVNEELRLQYPDRILTLPQIGPVRSLNLSQCAAVVAYEMLRQLAVF